LLDIGTVGIVDDPVEDDVGEGPEQPEHRVTRRVTLNGADAKLCLGVTSALIQTLRKI